LLDHVPVRRDMKEGALVFAPWPHDGLPSEPLPEHEVELWAIGLEVSDALLERLVEDLSPDEEARARKFVFQRDRRRFQVARSFLRRLLSAYAGVPINQLRLSYGPRGKPGVDLNGPRMLQFNVAHSGEMAVLAITAGMQVGVDLEEVRPILEALEIARSTFSRKEIEALERMPGNERHNGFLRCWTRKEAYVKALGEGLHLALDSFDVSVTPASDADIALERSNGHWALHHFAPSSGYIGALAVGGRAHRMKGWLVDLTRLS
jgi:4'-phosphopantetheinyl transferase